MCTALSFTCKDHYFGRNLDLDHSYDECITITPRNFSFQFRNGDMLTSHYAMIGMASIANQFPLYFEATNEKGLSMAGLNFPDNACYFPRDVSKRNIASFELIPYILGKYACTEEVISTISEINIWKESFSTSLPASPLHWILSDREQSYVIESTADGLHCYEDPVGVLTNNPPFPYHLYNLCNYMALTPDMPTNRQPISLKPYSFGMGSIGLPGDTSSASRFIRAAFNKMHSISAENEASSVTQFFHIINSVSQTKGCTKLNTSELEYTIYSSCCNTDKGIYYYTTYGNPQISSVDLHKENLDSTDLISFHKNENLQIFHHN